MRSKPLRAIDLYSGVGGWSAGLQMAGVEVVGSFERWPAANKTNRHNNRHSTYTVDIRNLPLAQLPRDVDVVVGSPPCTEFSYANRGGGGDLADGLKDIVAFLNVVDLLRPRWWVMENVPRVAAVIEKELGFRGKLARFRHLDIRSSIINMEDFGLPQRRRRALVGNIDFDLLNTYEGWASAPTLGTVIADIGSHPPKDPLYGSPPNSGLLLDHDLEAFLDDEERRINEASKAFHPVYNNMPFPDRLDRAARTITATCTRVSRESVVVPDLPNSEVFRRLTVRERASIQGFPITYQFYGSTHAQKLKMVGNAVPPPLAYLVGHVLQATKRDELPALRSFVHAAPAALPPSTSPDVVSKKFPQTRRFRFVIPHLNLKSGVRFELGNEILGDRTVTWQVSFLFGSSTNINRLDLNAAVIDPILGKLPLALQQAVQTHLRGLSAYMQQCDVQRLQAVWSHAGPGGTRPFDLLDELGHAANLVQGELKQCDTSVLIEALDAVLVGQFGGDVCDLSGLLKLRRNASVVCSGILVGATANAHLLLPSNQLHSSLRRPSAVASGAA